jgi:hypothetical protein
MFNYRTNDVYYERVSIGSQFGAERTKFFPIAIIFLKGKTMHQDRSLAAAAHHA